MNEQIASEALCEDCTMRYFAGKDGTTLVNLSRCNPEDQSDRDLVVALPTGHLLLAALTQPRPDRCKAIRAALPKVRKMTARWIATTACAEMYLISEAYRHQIAGAGGDSTGTLDT